MSPGWIPDDDDSGEGWKNGTPDEFQDDDDDWEYPDFPSEEDELIPCPACGAEIYDDSPMCPVCGEVIARGSTSYLRSKPTWFVVLGLLGIAAVIVTILASLF